MSQSYEELLTHYAETRDAEAFRRIVMQYKDMVYAACKRILRNAADAEDATQNCFLALARNPRKVRGSLAGWLHRAATGKSVDLIRRDSARRAREAGTVRNEASEESAAWEGISHALDAAINDLRDELRIPIIRCYLEGRRQAEVAREMGVSQSAVAKRLQRGVETLRAVLRKGGWMGSAALLATLLGTRTCEAAPVALTASLGKLAIAGTAGASGGAAGGTGVIGGLSAMKLGMLGLTLAVVAGTAITVAVTHTPTAQDAEESTVVAAVDENNETTPIASPDDALFGDQYYFERMAVLEAWAITKGSEDVQIGVIESGFDPTHEEFQTGRIEEYQLPGMEHPEEWPHQRRGTEIVGLIAAEADNQKGIAGLAPGCRVIIASIGTHELRREAGRGSPESAVAWNRLYSEKSAEAIRYLVDRGCKVLNCSYPTRATPADAFEYAIAHDVVVVVSSGEFNQSSPQWPAGVLDVLSAGGVDKDDKRWINPPVMYNGREVVQGSNYGKGLNVVAPCRDFVVCMPNDEEQNARLPDDRWDLTSLGNARKGYLWLVGKGGTVYAAPMATALAALIRSLRPDLTYKNVIRVIEQGADDLEPLGWDEYTGFGRINFRRSLELAETWPKQVSDGETAPAAPTPSPDAVTEPEEAVSPFPQSPIPDQVSNNDQESDEGKADPAKEEVDSIEAFLRKAQTAILNPTDRQTMVPYFHPDAEFKRKGIPSSLGMLQGIPEDVLRQIVVTETTPFSSNDMANLAAKHPSDMWNADRVPSKLDGASWGCFVRFEVQGQGYTEMVFVSRQFNNEYKIVYVDTN